MPVETTQAVKFVVEYFGPMVAGLATVGVFTKAVIDLAKINFGWRKNWQENKIAVWITKKSDWAKSQDNGTLSFEAETALDQLARLAAAGDKDALYTQKSEKLVGLINASIQMGLDDLDRYRDLVLAFGCMAPEDDIDRVAKGRPPPPQSREPTAVAEYKKELDRFVQARNRVATYIQRSLDGLLISMNDQWGQLLQQWAIGLSIATIAAGAITGFSTGIFVAKDLPMLIVVAVLGGMIAPGINDFAKTLTGLGKKK